MKKFCVLTSGRSGSTSLVECLAEVPGVVLPGDDVDCPDAELTHPQKVDGYMQAYAHLTGHPITSKDELIDAFFEHHPDADRIGFKTMMNRHDDIRSFVIRDDIQFVTLRRRDVVATSASFLLAIEKETWKRTGGQPELTWTFTDDHKQLVENNVRFLYMSHAVIKNVPNAIRIDYEDLCMPGFRNDALDEYFGQRIYLPDPRPPVDPASYVTNFNEFRDYVARFWQTLPAEFKKISEAARRRD